MRYPRGCRYIIGVDEAGRGPLAGSVSVGAVLVPVGFRFHKFRGLTDAKKLTPHHREELMHTLKERKKAGIVQYAYASTSPYTIDTIGITKAIKQAIARAISRFDVDSACTLVLLDGSLRAPGRFVHQHTIIKGDEKVKIISLASIVAKVNRDRRMIRLAKQFPEYEFERHKGYGTKLHYERIQKYGLCDIHRRSFLKKLT